MARSKKNQKKMIIAISLGLVATVGVFSMVNGQKAQVAQLSQQLAAQQATALATMQTQTVAPAEDTTNTILAKTDIKSGEIITINKIEKREYKKSELPPNFFFNENFVLGKTASQDILMGKIITGDDILAAGESSLNIPPGMRAITIPTSTIQGLASYIYVGSKIDLLAVKSPPEFIVQNIKIIALETTPEVQAAAATPPPVDPAATPPAAPDQPVAPAATPTSPSIPAGKKNISADKATGITVLVPISVAQKVIDAMMAGKLQVLTRGNSDDKIYRQHSSVHINSVKTASILPPPPSGTGKLPSLPGVISPDDIPEQPKFEIEVISGNSKSKQSFDDTSDTQANVSSKNLKDLLKPLN
ncbi:MAG TPA: Flp pilus assembly protein CpaB [Cyanobacteria bacterium UBA9971]|nr:Flp pilus assembly protein CpaB [Cyanobacteria bacterium UBA9971]